MTNEHYCTLHTLLAHLPEPPMFLLQASSSNGLGWLVGRRGLGRNTPPPLPPPPTTLEKGRTSLTQSGQ